MTALALILVCAAPLPAQSDFQLADGDRVVFYTDALTETRLYAAVLAELYVVTRFPRLQVPFIHCAWPGRAPSARDAQFWRPTVLALISRANEAATRKIGAELRTALPSVRITAVSEATADPVALAASLLKSWNAPQTVSVVEVDAVSQSITRSENTRARELEAGQVVAWSQDDEAVPLPLDPQQALGAALRRSPEFLAAFNQQSVRVRGLRERRYSFTIDGRPIGTFTAEQLEKGINLAELNTPMARQASEVLQLMLRRAGVHVARWLQSQASAEERQTARWKAALAALDELETELVEAVRSAAQPQTHDYEFQPVAP